MIKILESDYLIIYKLIAYFLKDEPTCFQYGINLNKEILLSGPVGSGKTSLMNLMKHLTHSGDSTNSFSNEIKSL